MVMSWVFTVLVGISFLCAIHSGNVGQLNNAVMDGAQNGLKLALSLAGSLCLWTGVGALMERIGVTRMISKVLRPLVFRLFPESRDDPKLEHYLSANICANFFGLGNAATPMGIQAATRLVHPDRSKTASDSLCRLIVLNTASIQLIPATVAAVRSSAGCQTPFDILPAVWLTSLCSAGLGVACAILLGKVWKA